MLQTVRFKNELERNITIKLGYANAKVCKSAHLPFFFNAVLNVIVKRQLVLFRTIFAHVFTTAI